MNPLVSVLMVAYNPGRYLAPAVRSILAQSHERLELILVDNASTDGSVATLQAGCRDARLKILAQDRNRFHGGGLVAGLPHCRGEFIAIMDADDLSHPQRLKRQVAVLLADDALDAVACAVQTINEEGEVIGPGFPWRTTAEINAFVRYDMPVTFPSLTGRRTLFESVPFRPEFTRAMDYDFVTRATRRHRFVCLDEVLVSYRSHPAATTHSQAVAMFAEACVIRLALARREAGMAENLPALLAEQNRLLQTGSVGDVALFFADQCLAEGFLELAVLHGRKAARQGKWGGGIRIVTHALRRGCRKLPAAHFRFLLRLAASGPVAALPARIRLGARASPA